MTISTRQYRNFLDKLELTQTAAAQMLGIDARTSRRYALDESDIPEPVNIVLRLMLKHGYTPDDIIEIRRIAVDDLGNGKRKRG
jgi:hypothetical protein